MRGFSIAYYRELTMKTHTPHHTAPVTPGPEMLNWARAGFIRQGTTFTEWCRDNGLDRVCARVALLGQRNGPKAKALRATVLAAAQGEDGNGG